MTTGDQLGYEASARILGDIDRLYKLIDQGKVARVAGYGAFVELENEIDGLVTLAK